MVGERPPRTRLYQITEEDLADLERTLPMLSESMAEHLAARERTQLRRAQAILSRVRWSYGPFENVERVDPEEPDDAE